MSRIAFYPNENRARDGFACETKQPDENLLVCAENL